jgi:hypothetical protein
MEKTLWLCLKYFQRNKMAETMENTDCGMEKTHVDMKFTDGKTDDIKETVCTV